MAGANPKKTKAAAPKEPKAEADPAFTVAAFSKATGCDRHTIAARLASLGAEPVGKSRTQSAGKFSLRDLVKAASLSTDADEMRLRKTTAETEKLELANARARGEWAEIAAVKKLGERVTVAIRSRILSMPLTDEEKDRCLLELRSLGEMDWSREA
ncbi:terminase small subunit [Luteolibacter arcticus]|uniref:Terminase small subunit n=1 Tax=Luteolibacter arcticus TaxID=1581411 RepID=A0ABT3GCY7_9BACT|nr:terminase small subunit [Luteolibacter arcticus]MCW1921306.1 terminase small subunit [Luteolibacter arcticus]